MKFADYLTNSFYRDGIISEEEKTVICFGLESLVGDLLSIVIVLIVGICFKRIEDAVLVCLLLFPLRKNAGGYHATTRIRCMFISIFMLIVAFTIFTTFKCTLKFYEISAIVTGGIIWILAPIDSASKKLDTIEYKVYKRRSRVILSLECITFILAIFFKWEMVIQSICMVFCIVAISLLMGIFNLTIYKDNV